MLSTDALAGARNRSADTPKFDGFQMCRLLTRKTYLLAIDTSEHKTYAHRNGERTRMPTLMPVMYALAGCGHLPYVSRPMISSARSEEHTSELQSRFGISYAVFCLKK